MIGWTHVDVKCRGVYVDLHLIPLRDTTAPGVETGEGSAVLGAYNLFVQKRHYGDETKSPLRFA
jgi:hypothetical protein